MTDRGIKVIRRASFRPIPWKNGGGTTHEAIRVAQTADAFQWRVSVAQIDSSGPFSDFTGYDRKMVLLQGRGIALDFGNGEKRILRSIGDWVEFDGGLSTRGELLDGPCMDLNLMVSKSLRTAARVERLSQPQEVKASRGESTLIFSIQHPLSLDSGSESALLAPWDLGILSNGRALLSQIAPAGNPAQGAVFIATISP